MCLMCPLTNPSDRGGCETRLIPQASPSQISWLFIQAALSYFDLICARYDVCGPASDSSLFLSPLD